jgi:hypothetical protein
MPGIVVGFTDLQGFTAIPVIAGRIGNRVNANKHTSQTTAENN